ncbi:MAG: hypothetical protein WDA02_09900 [Saccharofermentanales bacterium]
MALILNKELLNESGNTINNNYEDLYGNIHENPYLCISEITINKLSKYIKITYLIFKDKQSKIDKKYGVLSDYKMISHDDELYNQYFSVENMENDNIFRSAYKYINEQIYTDWISDEN